MTQDNTPPTFQKINVDQAYSLQALDELVKTLSNGYYEVGFNHLTCKIKVWRKTWRCVWEETE